MRRAAVSGPDGAVAAQHWRAAEAGAEMLRANGTAADAAVATAFAVGVCEPWMSGLGGTGLAVIWEAGQEAAQTVDFLGVLPSGLDSADYPVDPDGAKNLMGYPGVLDRRNLVGATAAAVPGAVRGLAEIHARYGRLPWAEVLAPAIRIAGEGIPVDWHASLMIAMAMGDLQGFPATAAVFLPDGVPPEAPARLPVPALADTLRMLADSGAESFYQGSLADRISEDLEAAGSAIRQSDLAAYRTVWSEAAVAPYRDSEIHTAGSASGGPRLADTLDYLAGHLDRSAGFGPKSSAAYGEALRRAWHRHQLRTGQISGEEGCTTHLSACDRDGNMLAVTYTLLNRFGSRLLLPRTGILMNNAVSYFHPLPGLPLSIAPGRRVAASNMCPVIGSRDGQALFAIGASGANRIVPAVAQLVSYLLDWKMDIETALHSPRIDIGPDGYTWVDPRLGPEALAEIGGDAGFAPQTVFPKPYACPSGVTRDRGACMACADPAHPSAGATAV